MHILIVPSSHLVTESAPLSGIFQYEQGKALTAAGHKVGIISVGFITLRYVFKKYNYKQKEELGNLTLVRKYKRLKFPYKNYSFERLKSTYLSLFLKSFSQYIKTYGMPDIVHAHNFMYAGFIAKELKDNFGLPFILTEHSTLFARGLISDVLDEGFKDVCGLASTLTCVSSPFKGLLEERLGFEFHVLHNIVDKSFFELPFIKKEDTLTFINVALLDDKKNQKILLKSFSEKFKGKNIQLKIIGDGPLMVELQNLSKNLGIITQVKFLGRLSREEVRDQMLKAHCFVLPSSYETFGVVLIEALASGLPLIATKCGGPEDIVNKGNGLLIDKDNQQQLEKALSMMAQSYYKNNLEDFNPKCLRDEALEKYSEQAFIRNVTHYYQKAIEAS